MQGSEKIQGARCSRLHKRPGFLQLTQQIAVLGRPGGFMRVWLPDCVYKSFPLFVGSVGLAGCLAGNPASLALGGVLMLYSGGVYCLRR